MLFVLSCGYSLRRFFFFLDFQFVHLYTNPLQERVFSKRKELSFRVDPFFSKKGKQFWRSCLPWKINFLYFFFLLQIGYTVAKLVPIDNRAISFGIFVCGVCPGGGASNIYTYLLGGDVNLSITMTLISTVASLGKLYFVLVIYVWIYFLVLYKGLCFISAMVFAS